MSTYDKYANGVKQTFPGLAKKANKAMGSAIRLFCLECMGGTKAAIKQVNECEATSCPLHKFRLGKRPITEEHKKRLQVNIKKNAAMTDQMFNKTPA